MASVKTLIVRFYTAVPGLSTKTLIIRKRRLLCLVVTIVSTIAAPARTVRLTGVIQAVHSVDVRVPRIEGQGANLVLTRLVKNGVSVRPGDILAEFDDTAQVKAAREAQAKYDDLKHQVDEKVAEQASNAEKRRSDLEQADADLHKAEIELRKGPDPEFDRSGEEQSKATGRNGACGEFETFGSDAHQG